MARVRQGSDGKGPPNTYARERRSSPQPGTETTCELCGADRRCIEQYDLTACVQCHHELLPGRGVF